MGYDTFIYLGPYIEAKNSKQTSRRNQRSCPNAQCSRHEHNFSAYELFCCTCGSAIGEIVITDEINVVDRHEIADKGGLCTLNTYYMKDLDKKTDLFIGNKRGGGRISLTPRDEGVEDLSNGAEMIETEIAKFKEVYEEGTQLIEEAYGRENYQIKWGLIIYGL